MNQAASDFNAAAHSAGERLDLRPAPFDQIDSFEDVGNALFPFSFGDRIELGIDAEVLLDGKVGIAGEGLRNNTDHAANRIGVFGNIVSGNDRVAGSEWDKRGHHADESAFARAVGAEETKNFSLGNRKADVLNGFKIAVALDDMLHLNGRRARAIWRVGGSCGESRHCFTSLFLGIYTSAIMPGTNRSPGLSISSLSCTVLMSRLRALTSR